MKTFDFTLKFGLPDPAADPADFLERLAAAGCDDAAVGIGQKGRIALEFTRKSRTAADAILGALRDVMRAIPGAALVEAGPDFVGLTDVARILGCSRQYARKVMISSGSTFPAPVHDGNPSLWRLAKVLAWAEARGNAVDRSLLEVARAALQVNLAREMRDAVPAVQRRAQALVGG